MNPAPVDDRPRAREPGDPSIPGSDPRLVLAVAVIGFFVITLDALVINVALPVIERDLGGGITGLVWIVDDYTLMFAALPLFGGTLSDRIGGRCAGAHARHAAGPGDRGVGEVGLGLG